MLAKFTKTTNRLIVTPTHDAYLDNGTDIGLTVGVSILAYAEWLVKVAQKIFQISIFDRKIKEII